MCPRAVAREGSLIVKRALAVGVVRRGVVAGALRALLGVVHAQRDALGRDVPAGQLSCEHELVPDLDALGRLDRDRAGHELGSRRPGRRVDHGRAHVLELELPGRPRGHVVDPPAAAVGRGGAEYRRRAVDRLGDLHGATDDRHPGAGGREAIGRRRAAVRQLHGLVDVGQLNLGGGLDGHIHGDLLGDPLAVDLDVRGLVDRHRPGDPLAVDLDPHLLGLGHLARGRALIARQQRRDRARRRARRSSWRTPGRGTG